MGDTLLIANLVVLFVSVGVFAVLQRSYRRYCKALETDWRSLQDAATCKAAYDKRSRLKWWRDVAYVVMVFFGGLLMGFVVIWVGGNYS